ncbi:MAG: AAA family ATPase [Deltaproteobacteria bacterium]|nr:AAA family ATPase [Deltaproteobacteria bacterium]
MNEHGFIRSVSLLRDKVESFDCYPFNIPAIRQLETLNLDPKVTFFVGENGSGKSTLLEAIAVAAGMNAEGGGKNFRFSSRETQSQLHRALRVTRSARRPRSDYFLRAESFYNVVSTVDDLGVVEGYGGTSLHQMSHGESFLALVNNRFFPGGLYLLDEPEAALSPKRQLSLLTAIDELVRTGSQLLIATHSPIILAYPHAKIFHLDQEGMKISEYEQLEHQWLTKDFLNNRERYLRHLIGPVSLNNEKK